MGTRRCTAFIIFTARTFSRPAPSSYWKSISGWGPSCQFMAALHWNEKCNKKAQKGSLSASGEIARYFFHLLTIVVLSVCPNRCCQSENNKRRWLASSYAHGHSYGPYIPVVCLLDKWIPVHRAAHCLCHAYLYVVHVATISIPCPFMWNKSSLAHNNRCDEVGSRVSRSNQGNERNRAEHMHLHMSFPELSSHLTVSIHHTKQCLTVNVWIVTGTLYLNVSSELIHYE